MGDIVCQDRAYTIGVLLKLVEMFEGQWQDQGLDMPVKDINACMFLLVCCLGKIRCFEAIWTNLEALRYDITYFGVTKDKLALSWPVVR